MMTFLLKMYRAVTYLLHPLLPFHLRKRVKKGKEDPKRFWEKMGIYTYPLPSEETKFIWIHGASMGESLAALTIIDILREKRPDLDILVTTGTVSSAQLMKQRLPKGVIHQFIPLDTPQAVKRFYDYWKPCIGILMESELWPNLLCEAFKREIPLMLVNGRMSEKSFQGWKKKPKTARFIMEIFYKIFVQNEESYTRFQELGAEDIILTKNLKLFSSPLPVNENQLDLWKKALCQRLVWVAASTHEGGEENIILEAHKQLLKIYPSLLLLLVPRHCERGQEVESEVLEQGMTVKRRMSVIEKDQDLPDSDTQVYIADTMGELGLWYRLAPLAFIGRSLGKKTGGQNPLEPLALGAVPLHGPFVENFPEIYKECDEAGVTIQVQDAEDLYETMDKLLQFPEEYEHYRSKGLNILNKTHETLDILAYHILTLLPDSLVAHQQKPDHIIEPLA
jgi:3-deoxy-D-manno-octulosonic-acid transferase